MKKYISINWIPGDNNLSDILTKCSTYHFQHRASWGFVEVAPVDVSEVLKPKRKTDKPQVALILVELCCQEDSAMNRVNAAFGYVGVTDMCEDVKTYKNVCMRVSELGASASVSGLSAHVDVHVSVYRRISREVSGVLSGG